MYKFHEASPAYYSIALENQPMTAHSYNCRRFLSLVSLLLILIAPSFASAKMIVLFPLAYQADQPKAYLYNGISSMLSGRISGGDIVVARPDIAGLDDKQMAKKISDIKWIMETAKTMGADYAVTGSITQMGAGLSLDLALVDIDKGKDSTHRISKSAKGEDQFIPMVAEAANEIRSLLGMGAISGSYASSGRQEGATAQEPRTSSVGSGKTEDSVFTTAHPEKILLERLDNTMPRRSDFESFRPAMDGSSKEARSLPFPDINRPKGRIRVQTAAMSFDIGDLDNDGIFEFIVLDREKIQIYKERPDRNGFSVADTILADSSAVFLKVSAGDVNKDGRAEIFAVSQYGTGARSVVWEWLEPGKTQKIFEGPGHLRILKSLAGNDPVVLHQNSNSSDFFNGPISIVNMDTENKLTPGSTIAVPHGAQFYTLSVFDMDGDGKKEIAGLDGGSYLKVWDTEGNVLAESVDDMGGTTNTIIPGDLANLHPQADLPSLIYLNSRTLVADFKGHSGLGILAVNNIPLFRLFPNTNQYIKHSLTAYSPSRVTLHPLWTSGERKKLSRRDTSNRQCRLSCRSAGGIYQICEEKNRNLVV